MSTRQVHLSLATQRASLMAQAELLTCRPLLNVLWGMTSAWGRQVTRGLLVKWIR